jgi:predicted DNA-binding protein
MPKVKLFVMVEEVQDRALRLLHERTRVPMAVYIREALDDLIQKYRHILEEKPPTKRMRR